MSLRLAVASLFLAQQKLQLKLAQWRHFGLSSSKSQFSNSKLCDRETSHFGMGGDLHGLDEHILKLLLRMC
eukprot:scaffold247_cov274-Pinguiococcus_pyrenoidosus.AAC.23